MNNQLEEATLPIDALYLDPNNPRFADISVGPVPEQKVHLETVQAKAMQRMLDGPFDVRELEDSIVNIGFLHVDRLVVVELPEAGKFMVIEGNRRLAAMKTLLKDADSGEIELADDVKESILLVPVFIIQNTDKVARNHTARILQGVRHIASIKPWGPYQQAQLVAVMLNEGKTMQDIKQVLGMTMQRINSLRRCYFALEQMKQDAEYGPYAQPMLFSHFEEALKVPQLRTWLGWDDSQNKCLDDEHKQTFYGWCTGVEEDGERLPKKIVDAKDSRKLPTLMANPVQYQHFYEDPRLTVTDAMRGIIDGGPDVDWRAILNNDLGTLSHVPAIDLSEADVQLLQSVKDLCDKLIQKANA